MTLYNIKGRLVKQNVFDYLINWDAKSKSLIQYQTKQFLKPFWSPHICYEEFPVYGSKMRVDILNATLKIAIEVNGPQHDEFHYFHNGKPYNFVKGVRNDVTKIKWFKKNEFQYVELSYKEIPLLSKDFFKEKFNIIL